MPALIYVSEGKLREYQPKGKARRWWRRIASFGVKAPLAEVQVILSEQAAKDRPDLAEVIDEIDARHGPPPWFTDGEPEPGEWVRFKTRLNFKVVESPGPPALVFWVPQDPKTTPSPRRLMLHGAPEHLRSITHREQSSLQMADLPMTSPAGLVQLLNNPTNDANYSTALSCLLSELDRSLLPRFATSMSGYARVTDNLEVPVDPAAGDALGEVTRLVVASPLFVERAD